MLDSIIALCARKTRTATAFLEPISRRIINFWGFFSIFVHFMQDVDRRCAHYTTCVQAFTEEEKNFKQFF